MELLHRRIVVLALLAWAPLLVLSIAEGHAWSGSVELPFLHDLEVHARLLLALPLLIVAELVVHRRLPPMVRGFVERELIPDTARTKFDAAVTSAMRLRNSITAEALLIALVYVVGVGFVWRTQMATEVTGWHGEPADGRFRPSLAGWWLICVSLPLFQFLLLRWYFRLFIWARFLWQVSRIQLSLMPAHPDRCGGLGFLSRLGHAFWPFLLAQGLVLAGLMANRILYTGAKLPEFKVELIGLVAVLVFAILGPPLVFTPQLQKAKRAGLGEYSLLAKRYVREFDRKWLRGGAPADEPLVGSADIRSLAALADSYDVVRGMRWTPFTLRNVLELSVVSVAPVVPLTLTMIPLDEFVERLLKAVF